MTAHLATPGQNQPPADQAGTEFIRADALAMETIRTLRPLLKDHTPFGAPEGALLVTQQPVEDRRAVAASQIARPGTRSTF